jgi:tetratricopeptide (TPR) repeat protein
MRLFLSPLKGIYFFNRSLIFVINMRYIILLFSIMFCTTFAKAQPWKGHYQSMGESEQKGLYDEVIVYGNKAIEAAKNEIGINNADFASIVNDVAILYKNAGYLEQAEPLYLQSTEIRKKILGEKHPSYASSLNNLAILYRNMGLYDKAEGYFTSAIEILEKQQDLSKPLYIATKSSLGFLYSFTGNYVKSEKLIKESLAEQKKLLPANHPNIATSQMPLPCFILR